MRRIDTIVCHYSATYEDQDIGAMEIDKMHKARGWKGVGYHYVIRLNGRIERGRSDDQIGAHVAGQNAHSIGICTIGGLRRATGANVGHDTRTAAQKETQAQLIRDLLVKYPGARVVGHKDLAATQCPAYDVAAWWAAVNMQPRPVDPVIFPAPPDPAMPAWLRWLAALFNRRS